MGPLRFSAGGVYKTFTAERVILQNVTYTMWNDLVRVILTILHALSPSVK